MEFKNEDLIQMYEKMLLARFFEEEVDRQKSRNAFDGPIYLAIGQEASAIGAGSALQENDIVTLTHRGHIQALGAGADPNRVMAEIFGKKDGLNNGLSGSVNFFDSNNILSENGIAGAGFPIACGAALTQKIKQTGNAVLCFGGDGSTNEGYFHESLNIAALWKLPIVFFIENNLYARSTPLEDHSSVINISERAYSYNIPGITIDGNDVIEAYGITSLALEYARSGEGPVLIEAQTYRTCPDNDQDLENYRSENEVDSWINEDPLFKMSNYLINKEIISQKDIENMRYAAQKKVQEAVDFAKNSSKPSFDTTDSFIFAQES